MATSRERERREMRFVDAVEDAKKQDAGGGPACFSIPKGMEQFKFTKDGDYRLRVVPYEISSRKINHEFGDPGMWHYRYDYYVHRNLGFDGKGRACCPAKMFGKACAVCQFLSTLTDARKGQKNHETWQSFKFQNRQLFYLYDLDHTDKGVQVYDSSAFAGPDQKSLGQWIKAMLESAKAERYKNFYAPKASKGGMVLELSVKMGSFQGSPVANLKYMAMVPAEDDLDSDLWGSLQSLDELPIEVSSEQLDEMFSMKPGGAKGSPASNGKKPEGKDDVDMDAKDEDDAPVGTGGIDEGDMVLYKGKKCEVLAVSSDGKLRLEKPDGSEIKGIDADDVEAIKEDDDDDGDDDAPPAKPGKKPAAAVDDDGDQGGDEDEDQDGDDDQDDEDEELDDDDDEDEPPARSSKPASAPKKPGSGKPSGKKPGKK